MAANVLSFRSIFVFVFFLYVSVNSEFDNHIQLSIKYRKLVIVVQYFQIVVLKVKTSLTIFKITSFSTKKVHPRLNYLKVVTILAFFNSWSGAYKNIQF